MSWAIVSDLEARKLIRPGDRLVEASAGNAAISLAMIAAARGYSLVLVMPDTVPLERKKLLEAYGAELVVTASSNGMKGAVDRALEIKENEQRTFIINQFENPLNPEVHRRSTAVEIISDLGRVPDMFVAGVGTGGTFTGIGEVFKKRDPRVRLVAVEPAESPILSGGNPGPHRIPGIGPGFIPRNLNIDIIDEIAAVSYEDAAASCRLMAEKEGLYVGLSSGAAVHAALRRAENLRPDQMVVTVCSDAGERYVFFKQ